MLASTYFNGYVSDIEILWVLIALAGLIFSLFNLRESIIDIRELRVRRITNGRKKIAITGFKAEIGRVIIQFIFILIGVMAMTFQDAPQSHEPFKIALFRFIFQWGLIVSSIILSLKSYWNYILRKDLLRYGVTIQPHELDKEVTTSQETRA